MIPAVSATRGGVAGPPADHHDTSATTSGTEGMITSSSCNNNMMEGNDPPSGRCNNSNGGGSAATATAGGDPNSKLYSCCPPTNNSDNGTTTLGGIMIPHENDVLLGRGGNNNKHSGNNQLRAFARDLVLQYVKSSKKGKSHLSRLLVKQVREMNPPGRFLKQHRLTKEWTDVGDKVAREKASQVLRDAIALLTKNGTNTKNNKTTKRIIEHTTAAKKSKHSCPAVSSSTSSNAARKGILTSSCFDDDTTKDHAGAAAGNLLQQQENSNKRNEIDAKQTFQQEDRNVSMAYPPPPRTAARWRMTTTCSKHDIAPNSITAFRQRGSTSCTPRPTRSGATTTATTGSLPSSLHYHDASGWNHADPLTHHFDSLCSQHQNEDLFPYLPTSASRRIVTPSSCSSLSKNNQMLPSSHLKQERNPCFSFDPSEDHNTSSKNTSNYHDDDDISILMYHRQQQNLNYNQHQQAGLDSTYHHQIMDLSQLDHPSIFDQWDSISLFDM
jgi:hypothetical protein